MREKEASEFAASSGEMKANVEAMTGALAALRKGLSASLLQTTVGQTLRSIIQHSPAVSEVERSTLLSFLESGEGGSTDQIIGIVDQMKDEMVADLKDTSEAVDEDTKFKANLAAQCATKSKEWDARSKLRAEEIQCISETIEMLNGDAALELFKKTLPSAGASSLLQLAASTRAQRQRVVSVLHKLIARDP